MRACGLSGPAAAKNKGGPTLAFKLRAKKRRQRRKTKEFQRKSGVQGNTMITP
jgi:hypothetical protein